MQEKIIYSSSWACKQVLYWCNCCPHPTWLVKKEIYIKLCGYRDIKACEDYDFLIRASLAGAKIINCPEVLLLYRDNASSISHVNNYHQQVIAEYIAEGYRNGRVMALAEINAFLHSEQYQKRMLKLKACSQKHKTAVRIKLSLMLRNKYIAFVKYCDYGVRKLRKK